MQELFYTEYFQKLEREFKNFSFFVGLSEPGEDNDLYPVGFIHEIVRREYLDKHPDPAGIEYYLCGPPAMITASIAMLQDLKVDVDNISYDEF